jgi:hypothetical protein
LGSREQWVEAALRVQISATELHRMQGVLRQSTIAARRTEKLKATDAVAGGMLGAAKLGLAAIQQAKSAIH